MAVKDPGAAAEFRRNESWLFNIAAGAYVHKMVVSLLTLVIFALVLSPLHWMAVTVFKTTTEIQQIPPTVFPNDFSLEGFRLIVESSTQTDGYTSLFVSLFDWQASSIIDIDILSLVLNSPKVAIGAGAIALAFETAASYVFSCRNFTRKNMLMSTFLASSIFPGTVIMVPEWEFISAPGLFDMHFVSIFIYGVMTAPSVVWLAEGSFDDFLNSIIEAPHIDQCSSIETSWYVIVPMTRNSLIASFVFAFLFAWNESVLALTLLDNLRYMAPSGPLASVQGFNTQWNAVAAASIIIPLPVPFGLAYIQHYFVQGLAGGTTKG